MRLSNKHKILGFCLAGAVAIFGADARAQTANVFTVSAIQVDVVSKTAADARKQALAEGERRAFEQLLRRLTLRDGYQRLPKFTADEIASFVLEFSVANEKNSPVRYLADLTFQFKPAEIRNLLRDEGIEFAETKSKPVLILPVFERAGAVALWDDPNPWRKAWTDMPKVDGLVPMRLPGGDLKDIGMLGAEQAVKGDRQRLAAIAERYAVSATIVAHATLERSRLGAPILKLEISTYGNEEREQSLATTLSADEGENEDALIVRAAGLIRAMIEDQWKQENVLQFGQNSVLAAVLPIKGLSDWVESKRRLARVAVIERVDLVLLSRREARINLYYLGEPHQLKLALLQEDLKLTEAEEGEWTLIPIRPTQINKGRMRK